MVLRVTKVLLLGASIFLLAGCSSMSMHSGGKSGQGMNGAQASGINGPANFAGGNQPANQTTYYFAFASNQVRQQDMPAIHAQARYLLSHPKKYALVAGNTDARGSREYNIGLGWRRANAVADILRLDGVSSKQIKKVSYGEEKPVTLGHTEAAYRLNRRVDLTYHDIK